jgi:hypothetical protein
MFDSTCKENLVFARSKPAGKSPNAIEIPSLDVRTLVPRTKRKVFVENIFSFDSL